MEGLIDVEGHIAYYLAGMGIMALAFFIVGAFPEPPWVWGREYRAVVKERDRLQAIVDRSVPALEVLADQVALKRAIEDGLNEGELKALCFELNVSYDDLGGQTKAERVIGLVSYFTRRDDTASLMAYLRKARPDVWRKAVSP